MAIQELQAAVTASVWRAVAQSKVDLSGMKPEDMNRLVQLMVDAALTEVDKQLGQEVGGQLEAAQLETGQSEAGAEEVVLWEGRPFLSLTRHYTITNERIRVTEGMLGKVREDIELIRVQDIDHTQSMTERALNLGDVHISSHDPNRPTVVLENITDPQAVHEILRRAVLKAREKYRLHYREEM